MNTFSLLMTDLSNHVRMDSLVVKGNEFGRVAIFVTASNKESYTLEWPGADPDPRDFSLLVQELIAQFGLISD